MTSLKKVKFLFDFQKGGGRFKENFIKTASANIIAQAIGIAIVPILSRFYSPSDFGLFATYMAILSTLSAVSTLRFDWSIPNTSNENEGACLFIISIVLGFTFSALLCLVIVMLINEPWLPDGLSSLGGYVYVLPISLVFMSVFQVFHAWCVKINDLADVGKATVNQKISDSGLSVVLGTFSVGFIGLLISQIVGVLFSILTILKKVNKTFIWRLDLASFISAWKIYISEALISTSVSLVRVMSVSIIPLMLVNYFSPSEVGVFALMQRISLAPISFVTNAVAKSFWSEASVLVHTDKVRLRSLYISVFKRLFVLAIPVCFVCITGPVWVHHILGDSWSGAGVVLSMFSPWVFAQIVSQPITHLIVHRKQHWKLYVDLVVFILVFTSIVFLGSQKSELYEVILVVSIVQACGYIALFFLNYWCLRK